MAMIVIHIKYFYQLNYQSTYICATKNNHSCNYFEIHLLLMVHSLPILLTRLLWCRHIWAFFFRHMPCVIAAFALPMTWAEGYMKCCF